MSNHIRDLDASLAAHIETEARWALSRSGRLKEKYLNVPKIKLGFLDRPASSQVTISTTLSLATGRSSFLRQIKLYLPSLPLVCHTRVFTRAILSVGLMPKTDIQCSNAKQSR